MSSQPLPESWVDKIFSRLTAIYGMQKLAGMWADADMAEVKRTWAVALGKYPPAAIAAALQDLPEMPSQWPPTLPEFVGLVRDASESMKYNRQLLRLPEPDMVAKKDSPAVQDALAQLRAFVKSRSV